MRIPLQLERAVIQLLNNINVLADEYDIDTVHRLPSQRSPKTTIVRFNSRKVVRDVHLNKHKLRNLDELNLEIPGINADSKIFIRASQSPYMLKTWHTTVDCLKEAIVLPKLSPVKMVV